MRFAFIALLFLCETAFSDDVTLEGIWVLDKAMTEASLRESGASLPAPLLRNLQDSYDAMAYVFKGNRTTYTQKSTVEDQPNWYSWKQQFASEDTITINVSGLNEDVEFSRKDNCIGLLIENFNYSEFYCLQEK